MEAVLQFEEQGKGLHAGYARVIKVLIRLYKVNARDIANGVENGIQVNEMV